MKDTPFAAILLVAVATLAVSLNTCHGRVCVTYSINWNETTANCWETITLVGCRGYCVSSEVSHYEI